MNPEKYAKAIFRGKKTMKDVPSELKEEVECLLIEMGYDFESEF